LAISQGDPASALGWVEQARRESDAAKRHTDAALPELRALARAQRLAEAVRFTVQQPAVAPGLLGGLIACLEREDIGRAALDAADRGELAAAQASLSVLAQSDDVPPDTAHHLALIYLRGALFAEQSDAVRADELWRLSWRCWLGWSQSANPTDRNLIFSWLLTEHKTAIKDSLTRSAIDAARRHWLRVMDFVANPILAKRIEAFRDQLATEYLVQTRESMRYGSVPAGYDADYEAGLNCLARLLSLDGENKRLLTEVVSICTEWFHESYGIGDLQALARGVDRFTPFALHLGRRIGQNDAAELTARAVLAEFTKYRGFVCDDPARKAELYQEAQRWHPARGRLRTESLS